MLDSVNKNIAKFNKFVNEANRNAIEGSQTEQNASINTTGRDVAEIRNQLDAFANLIMTFPVTDRDTRLVLPAFITSHSDSFSPGWNPQQVYGRADPIPIYRNTTRAISLGFKIPNRDIADANANFAALGTIIKNLYPVYKSFGSADIAGAFRDAFSGLSPNQVIAGAPLVRIKYANLLCNSSNPSVGLLGYITNLSVTMDTDNGFLMDLSLNTEGEEPVMFPRMVNFTFSFSPLHEHKLGWGPDSNWLGGERKNFPYATRKVNSQVKETQNFNVNGAVADGNASAVINNLFEF
jgi:hypothetical protein